MRCATCRRGSTPTSPTGRGPPRCRRSSTRFWRPARGYVRTSPGLRSRACAPTGLPLDTSRVISPPIRRREENAWWAPTPHMRGPRYGPRAICGWHSTRPTTRWSTSATSWWVGVATTRTSRRCAASSTPTRRAASSTCRWMSRRSRAKWPMRDFVCPNCGQHLAFENSVCLSCDSPLGFSLDDTALLVIAEGSDVDKPGYVDSQKYQLCANLHLAECNWLVTKEPVRRLCASCRLTRTRPNDADIKALAAFAAAEKAKRRLLVELSELKLPIVGRDEDPQYGLAFDLLSSEEQKVYTGHHNGVITLDLAEGDDVHRVQLQVAMDEPYRTLLGHFRHEVGHYYYYRLVEPSQDYKDQFQELFGDADADYQAALDRHYNEGAP